MSRQLPSITALLCFEATSRHLNASRAAEELHLSQSAVSHQLRNLESFLDLQLFERVRQRLILTDSGRSYLREVAPLLLQLDEATQRVRGAAQQLRIASEPAFTSRWLMPRLKAFRQRHPDLSLEIQTDNAPLQNVEGFDVALSHDAHTLAGFQFEPLMEEVLIAVASPEFMSQREVFSELAGIAEYPLIHHAVQQEVSSTIIWLQAAGLDYREMPGQRFDSFRLVTDAARQDMGVAVVPSFFVEEELARGVLVEACSRRLSTGHSYQLAIAEEKLGSRKVELFRSWILQPGLLSEAP